MAVKLLLGSLLVAHTMYSDQIVLLPKSRNFPDRISAKHLNFFQFPVGGCDKAAEPDRCHDCKPRTFMGWTWTNEQQLIDLHATLLHERQDMHGCHVLIIAC